MPPVFDVITHVAFRRNTRTVGTTYFGRNPTSLPLIPGIQGRYTVYHVVSTAVQTHQDPYWLRMYLPGSTYSIFRTSSISRAP